MTDYSHNPGVIHFGSKAPAKYREVAEPTYRHNCMIEALPRQKTREECIQQFTFLPYYNRNERNESEIYRLEAVTRITKLRIPMPDDLICYQKISRALNEGYFHRNPSDLAWRKQLQSGFPALSKKNAEDDYDWLPRFCTSGLGYGLFGASGIGKSSMLENALNFWPQVLEHTEYDGKPFDQLQVVWLKLDCPAKGSAKSLCLDFLLAIDGLLGTTHYKNFGHLSADSLLAQIARIAGNVYLGILVIDEIHRLCEAHSGGEKAVLNFLVKLNNTVKIPTLLSGTFKSLKLFSKDFSLARRIAGQGDHLVSNKANNDEWRFFVEHLWRYQFTLKETRLSDSLANALYDESQGILDIAAKLYMLVQWHVILNPKETITTELITNIAAVNFNAARPMLQALRANNLEALADIDDLVVHNIDLQSYLRNSYSGIIISGANATLGNLQQAASKPGNDDWKINPAYEIASRLIAVGIEAELADSCALTAVQHLEQSMDLLEATREALRLANASHDGQKATATAPDTNKQPKMQCAAVPSHNGDLRTIAGNTQKNIQLTVSNLKTEGIIKSPREFYEEGTA